MITLRVMAGAFLKNGEDMLMMKRSSNKGIFPGLWASVGGHVEPNEINDPRAACLREIHEETGLAEEDVSGLMLRYIVLRRSGDEIRISYVYFGAAHPRKLTQCDEGELYWIHREELLNRPMSAMNELVLRRYLTIGPEEEDVMVGILNNPSGRPEIAWLPLCSWEGF